MFKSSVLLLCLLVLSFSCRTEQDVNLTESIQQTIVDPYFVPESKAETIAEEFLSQGLRSDEKLRPTLIATDISLLSSSVSEDIRLPSYYVYALERKAFVIVSATERAPSVLAYSLSEGFEQAEIPCNMQSFLANYQTEIRHLRSMPLMNERHLRNSGDNHPPQGNAVVAPLTKDIKWGQAPYYNEMCPPKTPVGCVATATCIIMRYWQWPKFGRSSHSYVHHIYGRQYANYNHTYDWTKIPKEGLKAPNEEVARLCYEVAVAYDMNFDPEGSGARTSDARSVMTKYFDYSPEMSWVWRRDYPTARAWINLVKNELDHKRPVLYSGAGAGGGHAFVCDGYDDQDYFHINWGWRGTSNGWFKLSALTPSVLGIGGGTGGGFNLSQGISLKFMPPAYLRGDDTSASNNVTKTTLASQAKPIFVRSMDMLYISSVKFNRWEIFSRARGYENHTDDPLPLGMTRRLAYTIEVEKASTAAWIDTPHLGLWLDTNRDGFFAPQERLSSQQGVGFLQGECTIPSNLSAGIYRLRILVSKAILADPNTDLAMGEVEDYALMLK